MEELITALGTFWIVLVSGVIPVGQEIVTPQAFLEIYQEYVDALLQGTLQFERYRPFFSSVWTTSLDMLYAVPIAEGKQLVRAHRPVIQLQPHRLAYSPSDGKLRSMVFGEETISWGIQFSYPALYQDESLQVFAVKEGDLFPNTALFKRLQQWMRSNTIPTPFEIKGGERINSPIRTGKRCTWIHAHPQLKARGWRIAYSQ